jgi:hypothetical protein
MTFLESLFLKIGETFTIDHYLLYTKIQAVAWSCADILILFMLLKIASLVRQKSHRSTIRFRYFILWATAVFTPALILGDTARQIFLLESLICGVQFAVLLYTVITERRGVMAFLKEIVSRHPPARTLL